MMDIKEIFDNQDIAGAVSWWLGADGDGTDLAGAVEYAVEMHVPILSVAPHDVPIVWPWVENLDIKIYPRFELETMAGNAISDLAVDINSAFKCGAHGAQILCKLNDLERFAESVSMVRNDLFFNKDLSVGLDLLEIWPLDWESVFAALKKIQATSLLLILSQDLQEKSDFTGRIYAALNAWDVDFDMELHVMLGTSFSRAEQVYRLVLANRPDLVNKLKFFVSY